MTTHSIEIRSQPTSVWKGETYSFVYFTITYPSHETKELFHGSSVTKLAAFLYLRARSNNEKPSNHDERKIVCRQIEIHDFLALDFDGNEAQSNQPFPFHMAMKLSALFSSADAEEPCLVVRTKRDIFDGVINVDAFRLQLALEIKRHFPANYTIYNHCKNFFSPIILQNSSNKSDAEHVEEDILALSSEEIVDHFWNQVGDDGIISTIESLSQNEQPSVITGFSDYVDVYEYKLIIEDRFQDNKTVERIHGTNEIQWDVSSQKSKLDVIIHLKNGQGDICLNYPYSVQTNVQLLYEDGTEAPTYPLGSKKSSSSEQRSLFTAISPFPYFCTGVGSQPFAFRIEQISSRHKNHKGFRLKICVKNERDGSNKILPCVMDDIIIVKRKSRTKTKANQDEISMDESTVPKEVRIDTMDEKTARDTAPALRVPRDKIRELFAGDGQTCLTCHADLSACEGTNPSDHFPHCRLAGILSPYLVKSSSNDSYDRFGVDGATTYELMDTLDKICAPGDSARDTTVPYDYDFMERVSRVTKDDDFGLIDFSATND